MIDYIKDNAMWMFMCIPSFTFMGIGLFSLSAGMIVLAFLWATFSFIFAIMRNNYVYDFLSNIIDNNPQYLGIVPDNDILFHHFWLPLDLSYYIDKIK